MENTIRFPQSTEIQMNHYYIYKEVKAIESIFLDRDYSYLAVLCAQGVVHIYDNLTRLKLGRIDFLDILKESPMYGSFEGPLKSLNDKDKSKIIDSVTFSKSPGLIGLSSSRLSALFLIRAEFMSCTSDDSRSTVHDIYSLDKKNIVSKDSPLGFVMDPYNDYCFLAFSQTAILSNFLKKTEFKIPLEAEIDISTKKDNQEDRIVVASYLERFCSRNVKRFVCCFSEQLILFTVSFGDPSLKSMMTEDDNVEFTGNEEYYNLVKLCVLSTGTQLKTSFMSLNHTNNYLAVRFNKKTIKIFNLDVHEKSITEHSEFEANEGKTFLDVFFNVYDNQEDAHEDWAVILEKNNHGHGLIFSHLLTKEKKTLPRAILDSNLRLRRAVANVPWRNAVLSITDNGTLVVLEAKIQPSWINYAYKFTYTNENIEYVEREDEFDIQDDDTKIEQSQLTKAMFDEVVEGAVTKTIKRVPMNFRDIQVKTEETLSPEIKIEPADVKLEEEAADTPEDSYDHPRKIIKERIDEELQE